MEKFVERVFENVGFLAETGKNGKKKIDFSSGE